MNLSPMIKQTILSPFKKGDKVITKEIEGYRLGDSPYFAMKIDEGQWGLVHYPTGLRIGGSDVVVSARKQIVDLIPQYESLVAEAEKRIKDDQILNK